MLDSGLKADCNNNHRTGRVPQVALGYATAAVLSMVALDLTGISPSTVYTHRRRHKGFPPNGDNCSTVPHRYIAG